jgi:lysophospholipase L1-like esterase
MRWTSPQTAGLATATLMGTVAGMLLFSSPPGVDMAPVLMELGALIGLVGLLCMALFAAAVPSDTPDRLGNAVRSTAIVLAILTVGGGIRASLDIGEAAQVSDDILIDRPDLGHGVALLRPNLRGATIVAPDRPHNPQDLSAGDRFDRTQRTRVFKVDTNAAGFRGPAISPASGQPRIAALGDSFTFGWGVSHGSAWPAQLQTLTGTETLNLGIPAANLDTLTALAGMQGQQWEATIVLVCEWPLLMSRTPVSQFVRQIEHIKAAVSPARVGVILPAVSSFDPMGADIPAGMVEQLRTALADTPLLDLGIAIQAAGGSGVVLHRQNGQQILTRVPSGEALVTANGPTDRIAEPIIRALEADHSLVEPLFFDGGHTTAEGNTVVAQATASWLRHLGWIP